MLLPVVFAIALVARRGSGGEGGKARLPLFLVGFAALVLLNSFALLPKVTTDLANDISRWCLVTAIAALGMKTSFKDLAAYGWRPVALMAAETLWIAAFSIGLIKLAG
jgi:uncharacterized membrane protein YadS